MPCSIVSPSSTTTTSFTPVVVPLVSRTAPSAASQSDGPIVGGPPYSPPGSCDMPADGYAGTEVYAKQISKNFTLARFTTGAVYPHKIDTSRFASPPTAFTPQQIACNLSHLAKTLMDPISDKMKTDGYNISITSGFRASTAGNPTSDHGRGLACDFQASGWTESYRVTLIKWITSTMGASVRQVIFEKSAPGGALGWIHVAVCAPGYPALGSFQIATCVNGDQGKYATYTPGLPGSAGVPYTVRS